VIMPLNYTTYVTQLANLMSIANSSNPTDPSFLIFLPGCIDYAEQRIYRDLDLVATRVTDTSASFAIQQRTFTLPTTQGTFEVLEEVSAISPAGTGPTNGTRYPLYPVSKQFIDALYPNATTANTIPQFYARTSYTSILVGPAADAAYVAEVIGTQRPIPLSVTNSSTYLTANLPDLFMAGSMVFGSAFQRDFGAQADNPAQAQSWETQYGKLLESANTEENRKKFFSQGWTMEQPSRDATPARV